MSLQKFAQHYTYQFPSEVVQQLQTKTYERQEAIVQTGDDIDGIYFLVEGCYYVSSVEITGRELLLRYCKAPAILGDIEVIERCNIQSNCIAAERCEFLFVPMHTCKQFLQHDAAFSQLLLKELAYKLKTCTISSRVNALSSVATRLAAYYCTLASVNTGSEYIETRTLSEVASLIGTTKRHVNRILKAWQEERIVVRTGDTLHIVDWKKLERYSNDVRFE